jgi:hypothetical protein
MLHVYIDDITTSATLSDTGTPIVFTHQKGIKGYKRIGEGLKPFSGASPAVPEIVC